MALLWLKPVAARAIAKADAIALAEASAAQASTAKKAQEEKFLTGTGR
jgi:hypothetical protein